MKTRIIATFLLASVALPSGPAFAQTAGAATLVLGPDPEGTIDPAFVGTAPGGPPWWKVSKGDATIWVLGMPAGRVPVDEPINGAALRRTLADAEVLITDVSLWRGIRVGGVEPPLPSPLSTKIGGAANRMHRQWRPGRVTLSDAFWTWLEFATYSRTSDDRTILTLATRVNRKLRVIEPPLQPSPPLASYDPASPEVRACVESMLKDMENPTKPSETAWRAWEAGDVAGALSAPRSIGWTCEILWPGAWERAVGFHVEAIAMGLEMPKKIVAAIDIGELVAADGVLPRLRARGYEVSGPLQPTERKR